VNRAVWQTWQSNPTQDVLDSFNTFINNVDTSLLSEEALASITRSLYGPGSEDSLTSDTSKSVFEVLREDLSEKAIFAEARHRALARVNLSVDQMASAASP